MPGHIQGNCFQNTAYCFTLPCPCTDGSMGRILLVLYNLHLYKPGLLGEGGGQSSSTQRTLQIPLWKIGLSLTKWVHLKFRGCLSFCESSGRGLKTREIRGLTTLASDKSQIFIYTHLPLATQGRESCIVKPTSLTLRRKEENCLYLHNKAGQQVGMGETLILYWLIFASSLFLWRPHTPAFSALSSAEFIQNSSFCSQGTQGVGPETADNRSEDQTNLSRSLWLKVGVKQRFSRGKK